MNERRANSHKRGKGKHIPTKPKTAPVVNGFVHPTAIALARELFAIKVEKGEEVHLVYDITESCMWIRNGAK